jgi:hypothetical protein
MSDQVLANLERAVHSNPDDVSLRAKLYLELVRLGKAQIWAVNRAAAYKDPAALVIHSAPSGPSVNASESEFNGLRRLPLESLRLTHCDQVTDKGIGSFTCAVYR